MLLYTICSYSNLNQAIVLYNSIKENSTSIFTFHIFLIDAIQQDISISDSSFQITSVDELKKRVTSFDLLNEKYNPFELCCALKPFCANYLLANTALNNTIVYLDSDLLFYNDVNLIDVEMGNHDILITPHFTSPPPDFNKISELDINNSGLYNGGFFAIKNGPCAFKFIQWWQERMNYYCFTAFEKGMFVDQVWLNFVPLYFDSVCISKNAGINVAYWNFHERKFTKNANNKWTINDNALLLFVHFSGYRLYRKDLISIHQTRYSFNDLPEVEAVFNDYANQLETNAKKYDLTLAERTTGQKIKSKLNGIFKSRFSKK